MSPGRPFRYEWEGVVRRLDLPSVTKLVAAYVGQYADMAGRNARPGIARLALEASLNEKTIRRHLAVLRGLGLLERVRSGSGQGRRGKADEYRLSIPEDILERVGLVQNPQSTGPQESTDAAQEHRTLGVHCSTGTPDSEDRNTGLLESTQVPETTPASTTTPIDNSLLEREVTSREADHPKIFPPLQVVPDTPKPVGKAWSRGADTVAEAMARRAAAREAARASAEEAS